MSDLRRVLRSWEQVAVTQAITVGGFAALWLLTALIVVTCGYTPILGLMPFAGVAVLIAALVWIPD